MTPAFASFVEPARARPQIWRLLLGFVVVLVLYTALTLAILATSRVLLGSPAPFRLWAFMVTQGEEPRTLLTLFATFLGLMLATFAAARVLHGRKAGTLFGRAPRVLRDFVVAALSGGAVLAAAFVVHAFLSEWQPNLDPGRWLLLLPLSLIGVVIQTGSEEVFFRGYLQQQLAARFASPLVWGVLPSVLFGLAHVDTTSYGANAWLIGLATATFGLAAADLTARTGSLGAAWGFHFANNVLVLLVMTTEDRLTGLALFQTPVPASALDGFSFLIALDIATVIVAWLVVRRMVSIR